MKPAPKPRGPWTHTVLVYAFSVVFGLLVYWLLGFVLRDIGTWPGPDYAALERRLVDPQLGREAEALQAQVTDVNRLIAEQQQRVPVQAEFNRVLGRHQLKLAALKLAFLLPVCTHCGAEKPVEPTAESTRI